MEPANIKVEPEEEIPVDMKEMKEEDGFLYDMKEMKEEDDFLDEMKDMNEVVDPLNDTRKMKEERNTIEDKKDLEFLFKSIDCIVAVKDENEVIDSEKTLEKKKFCVGDLIFARMKGYPVWPARVSSIISEKPSCLRYSVYFFGTHNSAICTEKNVFAYDEETKAKYGKPMKYRGFQQALDEIQEAASFLKQDSHPNYIHPAEVNSLPKENLENQESSSAPSIARESWNVSSISKKQEFVCVVSGKASPTLRILMEHKKLHENNKLFKCTTCGKDFFSSSSLEGHKGIHAAKVEEASHFSRKSTVKRNCGKLVQKSNIDKNLEEDKQEVVDCNPHGRALEGTHSLGSKTLVTKHGVHFICNFCNKSLTRKRSLVAHLRTHTGERPFTCKVCCRGFAHSNNLKVHIRTHTGEKPFSCSVCQKKFSSQSGLSAHSLVHTGKRCFKCSVCNKRFSLRGTLKVHSRIHTNEMPFTCPFCGKAFKDPGSFRKHIRIHTGEKPFECNVCDKKFLQRYDLKNHALIHSDEKPFVCHLCGRGFRRKTHLNYHIATHTGERPYCCDICKKCFITKCEVAKHIKRNHT